VTELTDFIIKFLDPSWALAISETGLSGISQLKYVTCRAVKVFVSSVD